MAVAGVAAPARGAGATVRWRAPGGTSLPQGVPLRYEAIVDNPAEGAVTLSLSFEVHPAGQPERAVAFDRWTGSVAGGSSVSIAGRVTTSQWFDERGEFRIGVRSATLETRGLRFTVADPPVVAPELTDVTEEAGLATEHRAQIECDGYSAGAAWGDVDGDRDLDLYLPHQDGPSQLWLNDGGRFSEGAAGRGVADVDSAIAAVFADYDNDGDQDLYVVADGPNALFRNDGTGHFTDVGASAGVAEPGPGSSAAWGDYDGDGHLDLFVVNWARCGSSSDYTYFDDALFHNEGDGTFANRTELLESTGSTTGAGFQAAWFDYDRDGDVDLYLANDYGGPRPEGNYLWRNDGPTPADSGWRFTNVSVVSGTALHMNTMGIGVADYDRDLDLDMALSNIEATALLRNRGDGTFRDVAARAGVARPNQRVREKSITWGLAFADLNLDGWEDLYVVGGSLAQENRPEPQPNATFANLGAGRFADLSAVSGGADDQVGRGLSLADYDRDGRMDLYVVNQGGHPILYRNVTPRGPRHWLEVDLEGRAGRLGEAPDGNASNRDGCGAVLVATVGRTKMLRQVFCGSVGLGGGSDTVVHFGLGRARRVDSLRVVWPSGRVQTLRDVAGDRLVDVTEPGPR